MADKPKTREPQYRLLFDVKERAGIASLGLMINEAWQQDPRRALFVLSRYKFVSKMLSGKERVLEVGCADAFGTRIVQQEVVHVTAIDFDPIFIADVKERMSDRWPIECFVHDILEGPVPGSFDAVYSMDVIEHIAPEKEDLFISNMIAPLGRGGVMIVGTPSLESQAHASPQSRQGHVNCKTGPQLQALLARYFNNVFVFSMNDEVVHTGYQPMAHYLIALCCGPNKGG